MQSRQSAPNLDDFEGTFTQLLHEAIKPGAESSALINRPLGFESLPIDRRKSQSDNERLTARV